MRLLVQRVSRCSVKSSSGGFSETGNGLLVLAGFCKGDERTMLAQACRKLLNLRIFEDEHGKMNRNVSEEGGSIMLVSQFTLCSDLKKGNRPSFDNSLEPETAEKMFNEFRQMLSESVRTETGVFGDYMDVELVNSGPCTFTLEIK